MKETKDTVSMVPVKTEGVVGIVDELRKIAAEEAWFDDKEFMIYDYAGGNIDDAYQGGYNDGKISLARKLLREIQGDK